MKIFLMKYWKTIPTFSLLSIILLAFAACSIGRFSPIAGDGISIEDGFAVMRTDSLLIAIRPQAWAGDPPNINANFFTVYIQVRNRSRQSISLSAADFYVLDQNRQYDVIPLQSIISTYQTSVFMDQFNQPFTQDRIAYNPEKQQQMMFALLQNSFSFGSLVAGGSKAGYIFFPGNLHGAAAISIVALDKEIHFKKIK